MEVKCYIQLSIIMVCLKASNKWKLFYFLLLVNWSSLIHVCLFLGGLLLNNLNLFTILPMLLDGPNLKRLCKILHENGALLYWILRIIFYHSTHTTNENRKLNAFLEHSFQWEKNRIKKVAFTCLKISRA